MSIREILAADVHSEFIATQTIFDAVCESQLPKSSPSICTVKQRGNLPNDIHTLRFYYNMVVICTSFRFSSDRGVIVHSNGFIRLVTWSEAIQSLIEEVSPYSVVWIVLIYTHRLAGRVCSIFNVEDR